MAAKEHIAERFAVGGALRLKRGPVEKIRHYQPARLRSTSFEGEVVESSLFKLFPFRAFKISCFRDNCMIYLEIFIVGCSFFICIFWPK